jgi:hypothetical protein
LRFGLATELLTSWARWQTSIVESHQYGTSRSNIQECKTHKGGLFRMFHLVKLKGALHNVFQQRAALLAIADRLVHTSKLCTIVLYSTPLCLQQARWPLLTSDGAICFVMLPYSVPECSRTLAIPVDGVLQDVKKTSAQLMLLVLIKVLPFACPSRRGRHHHSFDFAGMGCNTMSRNSRKHGERRHLEAVLQERTRGIWCVLERSH